MPRNLRAHLQGEGHAAYCAGVKPEWKHMRYILDGRVTKKWDNYKSCGAEPEGLWSDHVACNGFAYVSYLGSVSPAWKKNRWLCQWERRKVRTLWCAACLGQSFNRQLQVSAVCVYVQFLFSMLAVLIITIPLTKCFKAVLAYIPAQDLRHYQSLPSNQGLVWMWRTQTSA